MCGFFGTAGPGTDSVHLQYIGPSTASNPIAVQTPLPGIVFVYGASLNTLFGSPWDNEAMNVHP